MINYFKKYFAKSNNYNNNDHIISKQDFQKKKRVLIDQVEIIIPEEGLMFIKEDYIYKIHLATDNLLIIDYYNINKMSMGQATLPLGNSCKLQKSLNIQFTYDDSIISKERNSLYVIPTINNSIKVLIDGVEKKITCGGLEIIKNDIIYIFFWKNNSKLCVYLQYTKEQRISSLEIGTAGSCEFDDFKVELINE